MDPTDFAQAAKLTPMAKACKGSDELLSKYLTDMITTMKIIVAKVSASPTWIPEDRSLTKQVCIPYQGLDFLAPTAVVI